MFDAFAFLHYWGEASESELKQDVYPQTAAEDMSADEWWTQWIMPVFCEHPGIEWIDDKTWQYTGDETDHSGVNTQSDERETTTTNETETENVCPVCQQSHDGRAYIEAGETRLSGRSIPICIRAEPADTPTGADITDRKSVV